MKKVLSYFLISVCCMIMTSCGEIKNRELYKITDKFVESLYTEYESYGIIGGKEEYTPDKEFKVMPIGRLINVRIEKVASDKEYEDLLEELQSHYEGNSRVNKVYRCQAGTIMIDCRN